MQILILIVAAVGVAALSYFLFYLGSFFKSLIKMNEPVKREDEEEEIEGDFDYEDDDYEAYALDDCEIVELDETDTNAVLTKRKGQRNNCVISQIDGHYGSRGVYDLTEFLIDTGASFSVHKFRATCLLRGAISYVRFFQDENGQDMETLINLLIRVERLGARWLEKEIQDLEEREKTAEMQEIYDEMVDDFGYSSITESEDCDKIVELAISVLLPFVSGYTVIYKDYEYNWKLTNASKNIVATARQREWQRQTLVNFNCIEETLTQMQQLKYPHQTEVY